MVMLDFSGVGSGFSCTSARGISSVPRGSASGEAVMTVSWILDDSASAGAEAVDASTEARFSKAGTGETSSWLGGVSGANGFWYSRSATMT